MMYKNPIQLSFLLLLFVLITLTGCSSSQVIGGLYNELRFKSLKQPLEVQLKYTPKTILDVANNAEYFYNLRDDEAAYHKAMLKQQAGRLNIILVESDSDYTLEIAELKFEETTDNACFAKDDDGDVIESTFGSDCFLLNDISLSLKGTIYSKNDHAVFKINSEVNDETNAGKSVIGGAIIEKDGPFANILETSLERLFYKTAGKCTKELKKSNSDIK